MIERVFHCDWRECDCHERTTEEGPRAFLTVVDPLGSTAHFCTWDCLLRSAAEKPPAETGELADFG